MPEYNSPDDINPINNYGNSPFAVLVKCSNCDTILADDQSEYCFACEQLILEGEL
jgi:hypothetical protein